MKSRRDTIAAFSIAAGLALCGPVAAQTTLDIKATAKKTFYADARAGNSQLTFFSESTLEDFTGVSNKLGGQCTIDPRHIETFTGQFFVKVADLGTGIALRDQHMHSGDWLDAKTHARIVVDITKVKDVKKKAGDTVDMTLVARCTLHGQTRDLTIPATLRYLDETPKTQRRVKGDIMSLRANFSVALADYGITGPNGSDTIGLKVSETIDIRVTLFGSTQRPPEDLSADKTGQIKRTPPARP